MDQKEKDKRNEAIALFMGYEKGFPHKEDQFGYHQCLEGFNIPNHINKEKNGQDVDFHQFAIEDLKYHSSWDWLMPVIEKISKIKYEDGSTMYPRTFGMINQEAGRFCFDLIEWGYMKEEHLLKLHF